MDLKSLISNDEAECRLAFKKLREHQGIVCKKCMKKECNKIPSFNLPTEKKGLYCSEHKKENMIDVMNKKRCISCGLFRATTNNHNVCVVGGCFERLYPEEHLKKKRTHLFIQTHFRKELNDKLGDTYFDGYDSKIDGGCSLRRPDWYKDLYTFMLIMECDEDKHSNYICSKEFLKLREQSQDINFRPIVLLRFNPSKYDKYKSCYYKDKEYNTCLNKSEFNRRVKILVHKINELIDYYTKNPPIKDIIYTNDDQEVCKGVIEYLFF